MRWACNLLFVLLLGVSTAMAGEAAPDEPSEAGPNPSRPADSGPADPAEPRLSNAVLKALDTEGQVSVYRVPMHDTISKANLYILRRSIKQAIEEGVEVIVLDMDTPGGRLDITLEMMEILNRFEGDTVTYVDKDAVSAGAYISMATDAIYFAPGGVMGAAAVVSGSGQEIEETMKAKIDSYLLARMRTYTDEFPYRSDLIRAMADLDFELVIDGQVISPEGELLSLTDKEAVATYGDPPRPLLAEGIVASLDDLLDNRYGAGNWDLRTFEISWSEEAAKYMETIAPILLGLGLLLLFVEFKTPGFGIFGILGISLIALVFASNYLAGLAGFEAIIFFLIGLALIVVDVFFLPGTFIFMIIGIVMVLGSLIWSLSDIWPVPDGSDGGSFSFTVDPDSVWAALYQVLGGFAIAFIGLWLIWRYLPKTSIYGRLVHSSAGAMPDPVVVRGAEVPGTGSLPDVGSKGVVTNPLHPLGEVVIDGKRYQATVAVGSLDRGTAIMVTGYRDFSLLVDRAAEDKS